MTTITRRRFGEAAAALSLASASSVLVRPALAAGSAKIVIIGGGPAGATVANRLKAADATLDVTLVEPKETYTTCFYSNLYLGGFRSFQSITHSYDGIQKRGITVVRDFAVSVDTTARTVSLGNAAVALPYDRLVVAPGIDMKFDAIDGYDEAAAEIMPHAWQGGAQSWMLKKKLLAMTDGGLVVMTVPQNPYRCPPGPYERACMIGHFLKTMKPKSKLIVFDAKASISKQAVFEQAIAEYYKGIVELNLSNEIDDFSLARVDPKTGDVVTKAARTERATVANIIPPQRAGAIADKIGLVEGDWCPIDPNNFASTKVKDVYVLGDAAISVDMPKSAFSAMSQAAVVAADIVADLAGKPRNPGVYRNTCWSMVSPANSAKIGADYKPGMRDGHGTLTAVDPFASAADESMEKRRETFEESAAWYDSAVADIFGANVAAVAAPNAGPNAVPNAVP